MVKVNGILKKDLLVGLMLDLTEKGKLEAEKAGSIN